jgi:hypothetical protein
MGTGALAMGIAPTALCVDGIADSGIAIGIMAAIGGRFTPGMGTGAMGSIEPPALIGSAGMGAAYGCGVMPRAAAGTGIPLGTPVATPWLGAATG